MQISGIYAVSRWPHDGPEQNPGHPGLAQTLKSPRYNVFPQVCQLLLLFYLWLLGNHSPTHAAHPEGCPIGISLMTAGNLLKN